MLASNSVHFADVSVRAKIIERERESEREKYGILISYIKMRYK